MEIIYRKNGKKYKIKDSNNDLFIDVHIVSNRTIVKLIANEDVELIKAKESIPFKITLKDRYFLNGYQSWTDTNEYSVLKRLRNINKSPHIIVNKYAMKAYGDSLFYKYSIRKLHGYDVFYSKGQNESFLFNLNYKNAYLLVEIVKCKNQLFLTSDINGIALDKGESIVVFDYYFSNNYHEGLESFNSYFPKKELPKIFGYTSWYNHYQNINEDILSKDLDALDDRFDLFQIDDGYQTFVGDWLDIDKNKFPNGLEPIVQQIHKKGLKAGIWLAPFVVEKNSYVFNNHQDWIKKDYKGKLVRAGGNWSGQYALDLDNKEVKEYIKDCLLNYVEMGFDFFKLDFLYAAGIVPSEGKSRSQIQREAYEFLREVLKGKIILGCGANIVNSIDNFDYLRIGPDVSLSFDDVFFMRLFHRERISTKVTIQNTIYRSLFNQRFFGNDPDVFLLRDDNISLNKEQKLALATINALFGNILMTSDNIASYNEEKKQILDNTLRLFKQSKVTRFYKNKDIIHVDYEVDGVGDQFNYNVKKGTFEYGR